MSKSTTKKSSGDIAGAVKEARPIAMRVVKLIECLTGVEDLRASGLSRLDYKRLQAESKIDLKVKRAKANQQVRMIEEQTNISLLLSERELLIERMKLRFIDQQVRRQVNREALADLVESRLPCEAELVDVESIEVVMRKIGEASEEVAEADVREYLARLALGEIKKPRSFHPSTLETLVSLRDDDIKLFVSCCSFVWSDDNNTRQFLMYVLNKVGHLPSATSPSSDQLNDLKDLGLINIYPGSGAVVALDGETITFKYFNNTYKFFDLTTKLPAKSIPLGSVELTLAGRELARITNAERNAEYEAAAVASWKAHGLHIEGVVN
jgi:Protein of unknown function (DUF2806)